MQGTSKIASDKVKSHTMSTQQGACTCRRGLYTHFSCVVIVVLGFWSSAGAVAVSSLSINVVRSKQLGRPFFLKLWRVQATYACTSIYYMCIHGCIPHLLSPQQRFDAGRDSLPGLQDSHFD
jgi:hypothetical protein